MAGGTMDLNAVRDTLAAEVAAALGEATTLTTDPRGISPPCVLVGVPSLDLSAARTALAQIPVHVIATAPGNDDAVRWMLARVSLIVPQVAPPLLDARPGPYETGTGLLLPAITIIVSRAIAFC